MRKEKCFVCGREYEGFEEKNSIINENDEALLINFGLKKELEDFNKTVVKEPWVCCVCYYIIFSIACDMKDNYK